jgi:hypothetical protein
LEKKKKKYFPIFKKLVQWRSTIYKHHLSAETVADGTKNMLSAYIKNCFLFWKLVNYIIAKFYYEKVRNNK